MSLMNRSIKPSITLLPSHGMVQFLVLLGLGSPPHVHQSVGVGIGGIDNGRRVFAYRPDVVGEVGNFTDFFPTTYISSDVSVMVGNRLEREI
jgi:hypothetical protein